MKVDIGEEPMAALAQHGQVPMAFEVRSVLEVEAREGGLGGLIMNERALATPYLKDYDAIDGEGPATWSACFDLSRWGLIAAHAGGRRVGGAVVAFDTQGIDMLEGRRDLAVLWDIRVAPDARGKGVGLRLFRAVEAWAQTRACRQLKVETQNINVPACRFYARMGCELGSIQRFAYPELPEEIMLLWYKDLR